MATKIEFSKKRIEQAVDEFESKTSGELVISIEEASDDYKEAVWIMAVIFGLVCAFILAILSNLWLIPSFFNPEVVSLTIAAAIGVGYLLGSLMDKVAYKLVGKRIVANRTLQRAETVFLENEVFATSNRIGILLHLSLQEKRVTLIADKGINEKIEDNSWGEVVDNLIKEIRSKKVEEGLVHAIQACEKILLTHGFKSDGSNKNELSNEIV